MKTREELIKSKYYQTTKIQMQLFREIESYMKDHNLNRTQMAEYLGCSKGYITQLLSGDFDNKISKLVELSLAIGKIPEITYTELDEYMYMDHFSSESSCKTDDIYNKSNNSIQFYIAA